MRAIICNIEFMNFVLFLIKFIKFKHRIKFKKFELHNYVKNEIWKLSSVSVNVCILHL